MFKYLNESFKNLHPSVLFIFGLFTFSALTHAQDNNSLLTTAKDAGTEVRPASDQELRLFLGMNKKQVHHLLGSPVQIEPQGDRRLQNERWVYGNTSRKVNKNVEVYFENGRVIGWENN